MAKAVMAGICHLTFTRSGPIAACAVSPPQERDQGKSRLLRAYPRTTERLLT